MFLAIYNGETFGADNFTEALLLSLFAIALVFLILLILMLAVSTFKHFKFLQEKPPLTAAGNEPDNKLSWNEMDEDMQTAALVATIDYNKETKKDAKLVSIKRIDNTVNKEDKI